MLLTDKIETVSVVNILTGTFRNLNERQRQPNTAELQRRRVVHRVGGEIPPKDSRFTNCRNSAR